VCSGGEGLFLQEDFNHDCFEEKLKYNLWCPLQAKGNPGGTEERTEGCCAAGLCRARVESSSTMEGESLYSDLKS